jgi:hypothetical protein
VRSVILLASLFLCFSIVTHADIDMLDYAFGIYEPESEEPSQPEEQPISETDSSSLLTFKRADNSPGWHRFLAELTAKQEPTEQEIQEKEQLLAGFNEILSSQPSPRGENKSLRSYSKGHVYNANEWADYGKSSSTDEHRVWGMQAKNTLTSIPECKVASGYFNWQGKTLTNDPKRIAFIFEVFRQISGWEGESSAINTWDSEMLTVGAGFSAIANNQYYIGRMFSLMPDAFLQKLYEVGFRVNEDFTCSAVNYQTGAILHEKEAFDSLRKNEGFLRLLINLAQSTEQATHQGETKELRQWMFEAQFILFANCPSAKFPAGFENNISDPSQLSFASISAHLAHGGKVSVGSALSLGSLNAVKQKALQLYPSGRHEELSHMASHHQYFYSKRPCYFPF